MVTLYCSPYVSFICSPIFRSCVWLWTHFHPIVTNVLSETKSLNFIGLPYFQCQIHVYIVGEPKSRIVQKHTFFAPERYTAGILCTDRLNSA